MSEMLSKTAPKTLEKTEALVLSVEQLNLQIKQIIEGQVGQVWVQGELSNFKAHSSGHFYFSLKDSRSQITAVMFRGHNSRLKFKPQDGLEVIIRGRVTVYEPRGNYQIVCEMMEPVGAGALQKAFEQLKEKLKAEGLFDSARKRAIPAYPKHIAIVTSPTGAAIRDILNILSRRAKSVQVTVVPTIVQGEGAAAQICEAFKKATALPGVDVVIIGRGGGSIEDLWAFNDETLARTIASSSLPVISAVGHEIDFTIADFVADLRAPTPSAAAELVAKSAQELGAKVLSFERLLRLSLDKKMKSIAQQILGFSKRLIDPQKKLQNLTQRNDDLLTRLDLSARRILTTKKHKVELLRQQLGSPQDIIEAKRKQVQMHGLTMNSSLQIILQKKIFQVQKMMSVLDSLSPLKVVERGYSIVMKGDEVIKSVKQIKKGDHISIRLAEGELQATVDEKKGN